MYVARMHSAYGQVAVFNAALANPFNDWTKVHVDQGFAWRPGSVSFSTLDVGLMDVEVTLARPSLAASLAVRIIVVPFKVDYSGDVEVATVVDSRRVDVKPGNYRLYFEHGLREGLMWARLSFETLADGHETVAGVLRPDDALKPPEVLLMSASPAVP